MTTLIVPGDDVPVDMESEIVIGPGIQQQVKTGKLIPTQAGFYNEVLKKNSQYIFVESNLKKYVPQPNDFVIGTIVGSFGELFSVNISNFSSPVVLSTMAFPNASKKNRPNLNPGDTVYARVSSVNPNIDTEIECFDATTGKDGGFGLLSGGYTIDVGLGFARWLLFNKDNSLLEQLSEHCKFEIAIGLNGKVWIKTDDLKSTLCCSKIISNCQYLSSSQFSDEIKKDIKELKI